MSRNSDRVPVLVGVGEVTDRCRDPAQGREPLALMLEALTAAEQDSGAKLLSRIDSLDVVCEYSWPYVDAPGLIAARLGIQPAHSFYGEAGGESPVRFIHEAALRVQRGECEVAAVVGAESAYTTAAAWKNGVKLAWTDRDPHAKLLTGREFSAPVAVDHGVAIPTNVYPFYENATQAHWGQTQREALAESGHIWSMFSKLAATNPNGWLQESFSPEAVTTPSEKNRLIAWPYTKHMVANPLVNQGAAVLLTHRAKARELGIAEDRLIYIRGGAAANEPRDYLQRDQYHESHAQNAVLEVAVQIAGGDAQRFKAMEVYSCFPCVPKMARRTLKLPLSAPMSVTGGLSFFGAPLNNYMTHAAASLVRALRGQAQSLGLLYGQGEYVTKHHALVLSSQAGDEPVLPESYRVQAQADARSGAVPRFLADYSGPAQIETFTVIYTRDGKPEFGTVIARTPAGERLMARVPASDPRSIERLTHLDGRPVGSAGIVSRLDPKRLQWSAAT
ncbi:MAG: acetyl-CoA acetyltransferase [Panacagrimonas sp.]